MQLDANSSSERDAPRRGRRARGRRGAPGPLVGAGIGLALVVLAGVVAFGSGSEHATAPGDRAERLIPAQFFDYAFTLGVVLAVALVVAYVFLSPERVPVRGRGLSLWELLSVTIFISLFVLVMYQGAARLQRGVLDEANERAQRQRPPPRAQPDPTKETRREDRSVRFEWEAALITTGLLAAGCYVYLRRRRRPSAPGSEAGVAEDLAAVLDEAVDDLLAERDARRAVIAAYARLERTLAAHGVARRPHEAPLEYLARVLGELDVARASLLALTELFERAKFSRHVIDGGMKSEAIAAFVSVRDELRAGSSAVADDERMPASA